jgi:uncharacterized protein
MGSEKQTSFKLAIIGGGISGLAAAYHVNKLHPQAHITLFESGSKLGGHANTVDVDVGGQVVAVDTGFLVYNEATYPQFIQLLLELGVRSSASDMGFSVQVPADANGRIGLEWAGNSLSAVFAQRKNLFSLSFWVMLKDMLRFNKLCTQLARRSQESELTESVGEFLSKHKFSNSFIENYFLPMVACIWSCPTEQMMAYPMATMVRFCHNHGLLQLTNRPQWFTITGGSRHYVNAIENGFARSGQVKVQLNSKILVVNRSKQSVSLTTDYATSHFDGVIFACHSDQSMALLQTGTGISKDEKRLLGAIRYQNNVAVLHTDTQLMPKKQVAWAAWNYEKSSDSSESTVCLHYWLNRLQPLDTSIPIIVSLNPIRLPAPSQVIQTFNYAHPVFDLSAIEAQTQLASIQGGRTWFAGAWTKYGFHEDGYTSGKHAATLACAELGRL